VLTSEEAKGKVQYFFDDRFYKKVKLSFREVKLAGNIYYLEGEVKIPPRDPIMGYLFRPPEKYTFKVELNAEGGRVVSWELK
jgi:hypothetical protein